MSGFRQYQFSLFRRFWIFCFLIMAAGCTTAGPDYESPGLVPQGPWHSPMIQGLALEQADPERLARWWQIFGDPILSDLIDQAILDNLDLRLALARVTQYRALRKIEGADTRPTLDTSGSAAWTGTSNEKGKGTTDTAYTAGLAAGWEIDLFGRIRRSMEAADADLAAQQEALRDVLISLAADLAQSYIEVRTSQARLAVVRESISSQTESRQLTLWRYQAGLTDELAVRQASYNLESAKSKIPGLENSLSAAMNKVAVLTGKRPGHLHTLLSEVVSLPELSPTVAVGLPADAIRRRPDIREAENELMAQTARVGVATADLYPKLSLAGSIGVEGISPGRLAGNIADPSHWLRKIMASVSWNLFDAGAIKKKILVQSSLQKQALIRYESAILNAVEEVENCLVKYANEQTRYDILVRAVAEAEQAERLARKKYLSGLTDFTAVLESQRTQLSFRNDLSESRGTMVSNLILLYKALGGGWGPIETLNDRKLP